MAERPPAQDFTTHKILFVCNFVQAERCAERLVTHLPETWAVARVDTVHGLRQERGHHAVDAIVLHHPPELQQAALWAKMLRAVPALHGKPIVVAEPNQALNPAAHKAALDKLRSHGAHVVQGHGTPADRALAEKLQELLTPRKPL